MKRKKNTNKSDATDVRPLNQRESKMNIRKGLIREKETVNINWLEEQLSIDEFENLI